MNTNPHVPDGLVPIVIGATGHRDIPPADVEVLQEKVSQELKKFKKEYPWSPLILVSGLAEGADRLVARCALDLGWLVVAVLALPKDDFEKDFESQASIDEFRHLLSRCTWLVEASGPGAMRPACYRSVGEWIAKQSQWLIALWDGDDTIVRTGGTADVVRLFREGSSGTTVTLPDSGPVIRVLTRRVMAPSAIASGAVGQIQILPPNPARQGGEQEGIKQWQRVLQRMDDFNCLARKELQEEHDAVEGKLKQLNQGQQLMPEAELPTSAWRASWLFAVADRMALKAQAQRRWRFGWMIFFSLAAILTQQLYTGPMEGAGWLMSTLGLIILAVFPVLKLGEQGPLRIGDPEARYLDCRALAEACRVQYFWKLAGLNQCAADHHLVDQRDELEWIRQAVRSTELWAGKNSAATDARRLQSVLDCWIRDQMRYFNQTSSEQGISKPGAARAHQKKSDRLDVLALAFLGLTVAIILLTLVLELTGGFSQFVKYLQVFWGVTLASSAAVKVYQRTEGHTEHARSYRRMGLTMSLADAALSNRLEQENEVQSAQQVILATGIAALDENGDWLLLHRDRPPGPTL